MSSPASDTGFDPYAAWLGIESSLRPPTHYQLLEVEPSESRPEVIAAAAQRQIEFVSTKTSGLYELQARRLLGELTMARDCLLNSTARAAYDAALRQAALPAPSSRTGASAQVATPILPAAAHAEAPPRQVNPYVAAAAEPVVVATPIPAEQPADPASSAEPVVAMPAPGPAPSRKGRRRPSPLFTAVSIVLGGITGVGIALVIANYVNQYRQELADKTNPVPPVVSRRQVVVSPSKRPARGPKAEPARVPGQSPFVLEPEEVPKEVSEEPVRDTEPPVDKPVDFAGVDRPVVTPSPPITRPRPATVDELIARLQTSQTTQQRRDAAEELADRGSAAVPALAALKTALTDDSPDVRMAVVKALQAMGPAAAESVEDLAHCVDAESNDEVRGAAVLAMIDIQPESPHLERILRKALMGDVGSKVKYASIGPINVNRRWACGAVAKLGPKAEWALVLLDDILEQSAGNLDEGANLNTFLSAAKAIECIGKRDPKLIVSLNGYRQGKGLRARKPITFNKAKAAAAETYRVLDSRPNSG